MSKDKSNLRFSIAELDGSWGLMVTLPDADEDSWYWLDVADVYRLRDLIDELIERASAPPEDSSHLQ